MKIDTSNEQSTSKREALRTPERDQDDEQEAVTHVSSNSATSPGALNLYNAADDSDSELFDDPAPYANRPLINKPLKRPEETFEAHPTDPTLIKAVFKMQMPDGNGIYIQEDLIPEKRDAIASEKYGPKDDIFCPRLRDHTVPRKVRVNHVLVPWILGADGLTWIRTHPETRKLETFRPVVFFRRMNALTHEYKKYFLGEAKLKNIDPNVETWATSYNKWIDQIGRRSDADYIKEKRRDHWTKDELCAMYQAVNEHVHKNGVDSFAYLSEADLKPIADAVNAVGGHSRGVDAVRGQFNSSHIGKNPTIHRLRIEGPEMAEYLEQGGILTDEERYPVNVVPESEFPIAPRGNFIRNPRGHQKYGLTSGSGGEASDVDSDEEDEPEIFTDESDSEVEISSGQEDAHMDDDEVEEAVPTPRQKPKQSAGHLAAAQAYLAGVNSDSGEEDSDFEMLE
jgi:hypothetical protein